MDPYQFNCTIGKNGFLSSRSCHSVNAPGDEFEELQSIKSAMAASLEIPNGWQSPRISFTFDFSQMETERTTNDWQSPRISFSLNLSQADRISPEKRKRKDAGDVNYDTDFEFCVISNNNNRRNSITGDTLLPIADELFVDGKILPLIHCPVEAQPVTIAHHLNLERSRCQSPVRSTSSPSSKVTSCCWGNVASKPLRHKPSNKWKEIMFKLSSREDVRAKNRRTSSKLVTGCTYKEIETLPGLVGGSKPLKAWSISNKVQSDPRRLSKLKRRIEAEDSKEETIEKSISNKVQSDPRCLSKLKRGIEAEDSKEETIEKQTAGVNKLPASRVKGGMNSPRTVVGNGMFRVRSLGRSNSSVAEAASLDSQRPGRPIAEGSFLLKANSMGGGGVRMSPVLNVPVSIGIGYVGGGWNGSGGLFDFFSKREKKQAQSQPYAYHHYHSQAFTNRKKGT